MQAALDDEPARRCRRFYPRASTERELGLAVPARDELSDETTRRPMLALGGPASLLAAVVVSRCSLLRHSDLLHVQRFWLAGDVSAA